MCVLFITLIRDSEKQIVLRMAEKKCCIENCNSSSSRNEDLGVTYHKFPKDPALCNIWVQVTRTTPPNTEIPVYVCSRHFCKSDFQIYQKSKYVLKSGSIPSIFPWTMAENSESTDANVEDLFNNDNVNDNVNISHSSKESEPENLYSIKKFIDEQHLNFSQSMDDNSSGDIGKLSVNALDVIHKSQDMPIAVATSVMSMILNESEAKIAKNNEKAELKCNMSSVQVDKGTVALSVGSKVEAKDFSGQWHAATISEVDYDEIEVLVHYEDSANMHDEWISVNSSRLRPYNPHRAPEISKADMAPVIVNTDTVSKDENKLEDKKGLPFLAGERCLARWRDNRRFMATIGSDLGNGQYEVIFDDGFHWKCSTSRLYKLKDASGKHFDPLSVDTSMSPTSSALSPVPSGTGPLGSPGGMNTPVYHTHLFDPTRDYLGSKSERREMKRKLNIKEIFNIGQKKRKIKAPQDDEKKEKKPRVVKKKVSEIPKQSEEVKTKIPDAVASIIGTFDKEVKPENSELPDEAPKEDEGNDKITLDDLIEKKDSVRTSTLSDLSDSSDLNNSTDPVNKEEEKLENFDKPDESVEVIDKMKEVISKLEGGLKVEEVERNPTPAPEVNLEVIQVDPNDIDIDLEVEEAKAEPKDEVILSVEAPQQFVESATTEIVKLEQKPKKVLSKVKKNKKLRILQEKKVKKQVERVKNELEEMKKQVEEMRKQMQQKTEELAVQQRTPQEMPESFLLPGEWCCRWVNGEPVGEVHETEAEPKFDTNQKPALPRRTVLVEDKRLPDGWKKIMVRRSLGQSAGKWDVVLLSPDNKRYHTKHEMRNYLDQTKGELKAYENALLDFGIHLKLSRRMGWVSYTGTNVAPVSNTSPFVKRKKLTLNKDGKKRLKIRKPNYIVQKEEIPEASVEPEITNEPETQTLPIEDGYVHVGSLKVQVIDNLLRCPAEGCWKNFRNNTLLKMHIKHYHRDLKKMLGKTPKVLDLAYARTRPVLVGKVGKVKNNRLIKVKISRPPKPQNIPETTPVKPQPELRINIIPLPPEDIPEDSPKLRQALIPKPAKGPKVLLPVRRPDPEPVPEEVEEVFEDIPPPVDLGDCVDFEAAISTHTVTKPGEFKIKKRKLVKSALSEDDEWLTMNSDFETQSSFPGSGTPDSKTMDKVATSIAAASSESNEELKEGEIYMYTESGERIKIERMKREEIINCHCGFREEDGLMVQCELCLCWQHALCHNIQKESEVPEKYTCSICLNPKRGRRSKRFLHDQDRLYEGLLPGAKPCELLRRSHELSGNLLRIQDALHAMRVKYYVATKKDHPKLYLWAKDWDNADLNLTQERLNSDYSDLNIIINNIGKENLPVKPVVSQEGAEEREPLLNLPGALPGAVDFPITTSELERMARTIQEQETRVLVPQPEAAIENSACRERLLRHVQRCQALLDARLDSIEAQVAELESQDPSFEDDETADYFPRTKQTIQMLMRDLETMEELGVIT